VLGSGMKWCSALVMPALLLGGCGDGSSGAAPMPVVTPNLANPALTANLAPNFIITPPGAVARNRLFVMLPGTGAPPSPYRGIVREGAKRGFHSIGLTYPNDEAVAEICLLNGDPACSGNVRREVITGTDTSTAVSVTPANSITGRLTSLLTYLASTYPAEGWGQYLVGGRPNWSLITVAGHSQGAGHAGYLAKLEQLDRVVMFAGPAERATPAGQPAAWLSQTNVTPVSRQYGFGHTADTLVPLASLTANWALIGLNSLSATVSVDGNSPPFGNSH